MANGFACTGGRLDLWEATVTKYHTGLVTELCNGIAQDAIQRLGNDILSQCDDPIPHWILRRETGNTRPAKNDFVYRFEVHLQSREGDGLTNLIDQMGTDAMISFLEDTMKKHVPAAVRAKLDCEFATERLRQTHLTKPSLSYAFYVGHVFWEISLPQEPVLEHLGFSLKDI